MLVPEPSRSLYPSKVPELRAHVVVDGKPRLVFDMCEAGNKVSGFISGAYDSEFEVRLWDGRTKKATRGFERTLFFGDQEVSGYYHKAGLVEYKAAPNADRRFHVWSEVRVDDEHTRPFKFGPVPTTDSRDGASRDAKFLDGVSAIKIEYRKIHNVKTKVDRKPKNQGIQASTNKVNDPLAKQKKDKRAVHEQQEKGQFGVAASFGELKTVKKYVDNGKKTTTTYDYVNAAEPDVVFVFYIRSDPWIRARLADEEPEEEERSVTPPVEVGNTLYIGMTEKEVEEEEERASKRPRVDKPPQVQGKRAPRPLSRSPSPTSTRDDSSYGSGDLGGEDPLTYGMSDDDSGSDGDSYLLAPRRTSTSSAPGSKKAHPKASIASSVARSSTSATPGPASTDLVATLQAQLAAAEAANARLRAQLEPRPNKRKELGDAAPVGGEAARAEQGGPLGPPASSSTGTEHDGSHSRMSSATTMVSVSTEPNAVGAKSSPSSAVQHVERAIVVDAATTTPLAPAPSPAPAPAPATQSSTASIVVRRDSAAHSSAPPKPFGPSERSTSSSTSLGTEHDLSLPDASSSTTMAIPSEAEPVNASPLSAATAQHVERATVAGTSSSAPLAHAPAPAPSPAATSFLSPTLHDSASHPSVAPQQSLASSERSPAAEQNRAAPPSPKLGVASLYSTRPLAETSTSTLRSTSTASLAPFPAAVAHRNPSWPSSAHEPLAQPALMHMTAGTSSSLGPSPHSAQERAASFPGLGGEAFSLVPVGDDAQRLLQVKIEANEERLRAEAQGGEAHGALEAGPGAGEERLPVEEKGEEQQDTVEVKPEVIEERLMS
ncbi:hypothetical protein JCM9279_003065 [Rhodotorula babjevae]